MRRSCGMTFVELLVVVAIIAVMLTLALPSFNTLLTGSRFSSYANSYHTDLHLARNEAIRRNARVVLCKSTDGENCATSGRWDQGWIVFHDANNNAQTDIGEEILRVNEGMPANWVLSGNTPVANYISYSPMGGARLKTGAFQAGTLTLCQVSSGETEARSIVISATGRPRVDKGLVSVCP